MPHNEVFFGYFRSLVDEFRNAIGSEATVDDPREYRFDVEFPDKRYALQGYPADNRVFVGQYLGDRGVVWFDELRFDALHHGWRAADGSAWDFARSLVDKPSLSFEAAEDLSEQVAQSSDKESPTSVEQADAERRRATRPQPRQAPSIVQPYSETEEGEGEPRWMHLMRKAYETYQDAREEFPRRPTPIRLAKWAAGTVRRGGHEAVSAARRR